MIFSYGGIMEIAITGANGFLGSSLLKALEQRGDNVYPIVMSGRALFSGEYTIEDIPNVDIIVNLAGENIMGVWTKAKRDRIFNSRVDSGKKICEVVNSKLGKVKLLISASAAGYYGECEFATEDTAKGQGFLSDVADAWERSIDKTNATRVAFLRLGLILNQQGGALKLMIPPFKYYMGAILGSGEQLMPWISLEDAVEAILHIIDNNSIEGAVNLTAEASLSNEQFSRELARKLRSKVLLKIPAFILNRFFIAREMFLPSTFAYPKKLLESNFKFKCCSISDLKIT